MTDCPHEHEPDPALQKFRDIILEETDGGRNITRFYLNAMFDDAFIFKDDPWKYTLSVLDSHTFATDGHDLFIYDIRHRTLRPRRRQAKEYRPGHPKPESTEGHRWTA